MTAYPASGEAHRVADLIEYNYLTAHKAIYFDENKLLHINFEQMPIVCRQMLEDIIVCEGRACQRKTRCCGRREVLAHIWRCWQEKV